MTCGSVRPEKFPVKLDLTKDLKLKLDKSKKKGTPFSFSYKSSTQKTHINISTNDVFSSNLNPN